MKRPPAARRPPRQRRRRAVERAGGAGRAGGGRAGVYLGGPAGAEAARLLPGVAEVVTFDAPWVGFSAPAVDGSAVGDLVDRIRAVAADRRAGAHLVPPVAPAAGATAPPGRGRRDRGDLRGLPGLPARRAGADDPTRHEVEQGLSLVAAAGPRPPDRRRRTLAVTLPGRDPDLDRSASSPYVVVHPGASVPARALPFGLAAAAVAALAARLDVAVTGSRGEADLVAQVAGPAATGGRGLAGRGRGGAVDLAGLAELLRGAEPSVSGNTGPVHLAAAVGTPVVEVFAPVVARRAAGALEGAVRRAWVTSVDCAGCRAVAALPLSSRACAGVGARRRLAVIRALSLTRRNATAAIRRWSGREDPHLARPRVVDDRVRAGCTHLLVPVVADRGPTDGDGRRPGTGPPPCSR